MDPHLGEQCATVGDIHPPLAVNSPRKRLCSLLKDSSLAHPQKECETGTCSSRDTGRQAQRTAAGRRPRRACTHHLERTYHFDPSVCKNPVGTQMIRSVVVIACATIVTAPASVLRLLRTPKVVPIQNRRAVPTIDKCILRVSDMVCLGTCLAFWADVVAGK